MRRLSQRRESSVGECFRLPGQHTKTDDLPFWFSLPVRLEDRCQTSAANETVIGAASLSTTVVDQDDAPCSTSMRHSMLLVNVPVASEAQEERE